MNKINYIISNNIVVPLERSHQVFRIDAAINPYYGCLNRCLYCPCGWEDRIGVITNYLNLLRRRLSVEKRCPHLGVGTKCEPYSKIEKQLCHTRNLLEMVAQYDFPVQLFTKSDLIIRDHAQLREYSQKGLLAVSISIPSTGNKLSRHLEPGVSNASGRFALLAELNRLQIFSGAVLSPIIPFVNDSQDLLEDFFSKAKKSNAEYVLPQILKLSDTNSKIRVFEMLDRKYPKVADVAKQMYSKNSYPPKNYMESLVDTLAKLSSKYRVPLEIPIKDMPPERPEIWDTLV